MLVKASGYHVVLKLSGMVPQLTIFLGCCYGQGVLVVYFKRRAEGTNVIFYSQRHCREGAIFSR